MRNEKQLQKRREELIALLNLIEKYKILVSINNKNTIKAQITNISWLLEEEGLNGT